MRWKRFLSPHSVRPPSDPSKIQNPKSKILSPHLPSSISHLREKATAFSLVELLAVVGIIAMLSVAAVPVMRGLGGAQSTRATAQILVSALEQARTAAILSGTNAYLALPNSNTISIDTNYQTRSYAIIRHTVDLDGNGRDDFQTNVSTASGWVLLSKWERLPGDLMFDSPRLARHAITNPTGLPFPGSVPSSPLRFVGFAPGGALSHTNGTNGLLFYSQARSNVVDGIKISRFSGRVQYVGIVTNTNTF